MNLLKIKSNITCFKISRVSNDKETFFIDNNEMTKFLMPYTYTVTD